MGCACESLRGGQWRAGGRHEDSISERPALVGEQLTSRSGRSAERMYKAYSDDRYMARQPIMHSQYARDGDDVGDGMTPAPDGRMGIRMPPHGQMLLVRLGGGLI